MLIDTKHAPVERESGIAPMALAGERTLDLSRVLAGPWCTQTLADLGADVIKVGRPGNSDDTRAWGPPYLKDEQGQDTSEAAYYLGANRNKRSIAIDIAKPEGQALVRELAGGVDVLVENFKVGDLARLGNAHQNIVPYQVFEASDGHLILAVGNDGQFAKFCEIAGHPEWASDLRFAKNSDRVRHRDILVPLLAEVMRRQPRHHWLSALEAAKVPCGAINNVAETFADPQAQARGAVVSLPHPLNPQLQLVANPIKLSATPVHYRQAPPLLGQHTDELLREAGLSPERIAALRQAGVVA